MANSAPESFYDVKAQTAGHPFPEGFLGYLRELSGQDVQVAENPYMMSVAGETFSLHRMLRVGEQNIGEFGVVLDREGGCRYGLDLPLDCGSGIIHVPVSERVVPFVVKHRYQGWNKVMTVENMPWLAAHAEFTEMLHQMGGQLDDFRHEAFGGQFARNVPTAPTFGTLYKGFGSENKGNLTASYVFTGTLATDPAVAREVDRIFGFCV